MNENVHTQLVTTRDYLAEHGLVKEALRDSSGHVCLIGAALYSRSDSGRIRATLRTPMTEEEVQRARRDGLVPGDPGTCLINFNNHPDTTEADVLALLDRGIAATAPEPAVERELALA